MKYDPIADLNRENERRFWWPLIAAPVMTLACIVGIILAYVNWPMIEYYTNRHPFITSAVLSALCVFGLWRLFKVIAW